jgi:hypothetical protein
LLNHALGGYYLLAPADYVPQWRGAPVSLRTQVMVHPGDGVAAAHPSGRGVERDQLPPRSQLAREASSRGPGHAPQSGRCTRSHGTSRLASARAKRDSQRQALPEPESSRHPAAGVGEGFILRASY